MRKILNRFFVILAALGIVLSGGMPSQSLAQDVPYSSPPRSEAEFGTTFFEITEPGSHNMGSSIKTFYRAAAYGTNATRHCSQTLELSYCDPAQLAADWGLQARVILPICQTPQESNCMNAPVLISPSGERVEGTFIRYQRTLRSVGSEKYDLPAGFTSSLWRFKGVPNASGTETYVASATVEFEFSKPAAKFVGRGMTLNITPYVEANSSVFKGYVLREQLLANGTWQAGLGSWDDEKPCAWLEDGACGLIASFTEGVRAELSAHVPNTISGWLEGRIKTPDAVIESISPTHNRLKISAEPAVVSRYLTKIAKGQLSPTQEATFTSILTGTGNDWFQGSAVKHAFATHDWSMANADLLRLAAKDKAYGVSTIWTVSTAYGEQRCLDDTSKVLGIVATNAMIYSGKPPQFSDGSLNYTVAGMHYQADGSLAVGSYDLWIRSEVARCLYGFTSAPIQASIQVLSEAGQDTVATSVVSEENGWLKLASYGFTFSKKEIKVSLSQPFTLNLSRFTKANAILSAKQKSEISLAVTRAENNKSLTCSVMYFASSSKALAQSRAKAICKHAKSLNSTFAIKSEAIKTTNKSLDGRLVLSSK